MRGVEGNGRRVRALDDGYARSGATGTCNDQLLRS